MLTSSVWCLGSLLVLAVGVVAAESGDAAADRMLFEFSEPSAAEPWFSVDDRVMGGRSRSRLAPADGTAVFEGMLVLEDGGFASVRSPDRRRDLSSSAGVELRLRGDGRPYRVTVRTAPGFEGPLWQADLTIPEGEWMVARVRWDAFRPTFRGRRLQGLGSVNPSEIRSFGILLADRRAGPFRLEVEWIRTWVETK